MDVITDPREAGRFVKEKIRNKGLMIKEVAERVNAAPSYMSHLLAGRVNLAESEYFSSLVSVLDLTPDEVRVLKPDAFIHLAPSQPSGGQNTVTLERQDGVLMKDVYDLAQASRPLEEMDPDPDLSPIPVLAADLYPGTVLFRVRGESMSIPGNSSSIEEGDIIYCNTHDLTVRLSEIYVVHIPGEGVTVKRVRQLGGALWLFSDNPDQDHYPPFQAESAHIIGRVHYALHPNPQFKRRVW